MNEERLERKFLQSTLYGGFGNFFVSTIYRASSAIDGGWYYETFAWELDELGKRKQKIIADNSGAVYPEKAIKQHQEVLEQLQKSGTFTNPQD